MSERTALFPSAFHPHKGGVEELTLRLAQEQCRRGRQPVVVTMLEPKSLPSVDYVEGVEVLRHRFRVPEPHPRFMAGWALFAVSTKREIRAQLRERQVDLVHVQCVSNNARYALDAARTLDVPLVVSMQGELTMDATGLYQRSAQMRRSWRRLLDAADVITGCSMYVLTEAEAVRGRPFGSRARVIYNGVDVVACAAAEPEDRGRPYVLGLGRLVRQKGYDLLLEAFASLAEAFPEHELVIAGDGTERAALERLASQLGIGERTAFLGSVSHERALSLFAGATVFVLASRHEPQGIVILEAMAAGAPVVAACVGGVPEILQDGENGYSFRGNDAGSLGQALERALQAPDRPRIVETARARAAQFDWRHQVDDYDDAYAGARTRL